MKTFYNRGLKSGAKTTVKQNNCLNTTQPKRKRVHENSAIMIIGPDWATSNFPLGTLVEKYKSIMRRFSGDYFGGASSDWRWREIIIWFRQSDNWQIAIDSANSKLRAFPSVTSSCHTCEATCDLWRGRSFRPFGEDHSGNRNMMALIKHT